MSSIREIIQESRGERPFFGSMLLLSSGIFTIVTAYKLTTLQFISFTSAPVLQDMVVGVAFFVAGIVAFVRPGLSKRVGVGTILYVVLALLVPSTISVPSTIWTPVAVIGGLLCIAWATIHPSADLAANEPTT